MMILLDAEASSASHDTVFYCFCKGLALLTHHSKIKNPFFSREKKGFLFSEEKIVILLF